jgi:hypothetical protein
MCLPPCAAGTPESICKTLKPYYDPNLYFPKKRLRTTKYFSIFIAKPQTLKRHYDTLKYFPDSWTNLISYKPPYVKPYIQV